MKSELGRASLRPIIGLAAVLSVNAADSGAIGAVAVDLERSLHIGNRDLGLLVSISSLVGAVATVPAGHLCDRINRVRLLRVSILTWAIAQAVGGLAVSFVMLLVARVALGAVTATSGPAVASLTGDLFPSGDRGRVYGLILSGELAGTGLGILVSGSLSAWFGWRAGLVALAVPSAMLAWGLPHAVREPQRRAGDTTAADRMSFWEAVKYVVSVRTNVMMIVASSLGNFFFAGLQTFVLLFARARYHLAQTTAVGLVLGLGVGAVGGLVGGGHVADQLVGRGRKTARLSVPAVSQLAGAVAVLVGLLSPSLLFALPCFLAGSAALSAVNSPLDAARLDVVPSALRGRAEGVRTLLRNITEASAPLVFGIVATSFNAGSRRPAGTDRVLTPGQAHGLEMAFMVMLAPLAVSGVLLLWARHSYPADVAAAVELEGLR